MNTSCQVDFYVLARAEQSAEHLACQLAMMAWEQGHQVAVLADNEGGALKLDQIMWDYPPGRFLPHALGHSSMDTSVTINSKATEISDDIDVIINLTDTVIPNPGRYNRLLEIVPGAEKKRAASRQKFREYRVQGLDPASHTIKQ